MKPIIWPLLLQVWNKMRRLEAPLRYCSISLDDNGEIFIDEPPHGSGPWIRVVFDQTAPTQLGPEDTLVRCYGLLDYHLEQAGSLSDWQISYLRHYLPYCFLTHFAHKKQRSITVAHFAQSLDGKIATLKGDSRWIGNEANLEHAHRMRALSCGILIGKNTLLNDLPQLTVRRVQGTNPVRIIVGSNIEDCSSLTKASMDEILLIQKQPSKIENESIHQMIFPGEEKYISCDAILKKLYEKGLNSILIEGGAKTTSRFLNEGLLDILQLHLAPMVLGSGRDSFQLPEIRKINAAIGFKKFFYQQIANTVMFVGQPDS